MAKKVVLVPKPDRRVRRYIEVLPADSLPDAFTSNPLTCAECGVAIVHGTVRYYQRRDSAIFATYVSAVCETCGDRALGR